MIKLHKTQLSSLPPSSSSSASNYFGALDHVVSGEQRYHYTPHNTTQHHTVHRPPHSSTVTVHTPHSTHITTLVGKHDTHCKPSYTHKTHTYFTSMRGKHHTKSPTNSNPPPHSTHTGRKHNTQYTHTTNQTVHTKHTHILKQWGGNTIQKQQPNLYGSVSQNRPHNNLPHQTYPTLHTVH